MRDRKRLSAAAVALVAAFLGTGLAAGDSGGGLWTSAGQDLGNTRSQSTEHRISVDNVAQLAVKWAFSTGGDVSATPAVDGSNVYAPDWAGNLYAINKATGQQVWKTSIAGASGVPGDKARATPVIADGKVIVGTQGPFGGGGKMLAFDKDTGALLWSTVLDSHPAAIVTQSATVHAGRVYVGVSSIEEAMASFIPGYPCCGFRGSMPRSTWTQARSSGRRSWCRPAIPAERSGAVRPQSTRAAARSTSRPATTTTSPSRPLLASPRRQRPRRTARVHRAGQLHRLDPGARPEDRRDSLGDAALPFDAWTVQCIFGANPDNCPEPAGPDYDFGQMPALFTVKANRQATGARGCRPEEWSVLGA